MAELQIDLNMSFEFDKITESGVSLEPLSGPGCTLPTALPTLARPARVSRNADGLGTEIACNLHDGFFFLLPNVPL